MITEREAMVIRLRYGIGGIGERTQQQVADALNLSYQRVQQIEREALIKLRRSEKLESYWRADAEDNSARCMP